MKIIATSDTHGTLPEIGETCDLFIHAGDIIPHFHGYHIELKEAGNQYNWINETFVPWVDKINTKYRIVLEGNHGIWAKHYRSPQLKMGTIYRSENEVRIQDQIIGIWPFTRAIPPENRGFPYWFGEMSEEDQYRKLPTAFSKDITMLVSHAPPYGLCDLEGEHYGSRAIRQLIDENYWPSLKYLLAGHIHFPSINDLEYRGIRIINCAKRIVSLEI